MRTPPLYGIRRILIPGRSSGAGALPIIALGLLLSAPAMGYQQEVQTVAKKLGGAITKAGKKSVAVVDFTDLQGNVTELGRFLAEQLSVTLASQGEGFEVVDRTHLKTLLQEHKLSATGLIDPQTARKLGQIAGVECLVTGSLTPLGDSVSASIKLLDTNTAHMLTAALIEIPKTKAIEDLLAREIGGPGASPTTPAAAYRATATSSESKTAGARPSGAVGRAELGDILVEINNCRKIGTKVTCAAVVTNRSRDTATFYFLDPWNHSRTIVDDTGLQSSGIRVGLAGGGQGGSWGGWGHSAERLDLQPDLPVRLTLDGMEVSADATRVNISVATRVGDYQTGVSTTLSLRNLPLK